MILDMLAEAARQRVQRNEARLPLARLKKNALETPVPAGFRFEQALSRPGTNFICEVKKASPSRGLIVSEFPYLQIALDYEQAGAAAISVLTEPVYFRGRDEYLAEISQAVRIPVLRKDFIISEYQLFEAKLLGASAVLLISALLDAVIVRDYIDICDGLGVSALVETHDEGEIEDALSAGARVIGVNNRNLKDFSVDLGNSLRLRRLVPKEIIFVAESGISTADQVRTLRRHGVDGILIGEALMLAPDKNVMLQELRG
ncbi:MAG: indole-3-glycerol phosphate synthase TrpC [Syntrophomonadaceae bacterium]